MNKKVLVLNMGMKSIRSIIYDQNGNRLSSSARPLSTGLNESRVFQDPNEWWEKAGMVIRESIKDSGYETVDYITVTASASCLVYVDENCEVLDKCIMVSDKRSEKESQIIDKMKAFQEVKTETGQDISTSSMLSRILWVKNNQPEYYIRTRYFLSPNDYLIAKMTGEYVTDIFNAFKYHYSPNKKQYPHKLLAELGVDIDKLPKVVPIGTNVGFINDDVLEFFGLTSAPEVIVTTYDAICSFFGSGATEEGEASDVSGTVTVLRALTYKKELKPSKAVFTMPYNEKKCSIVGGSNNLGGGLIEWTKQCYYNREEFPYEVMEKEAKESSIGADGLIFLPYLLGERAPIWDNIVRGCFFGLERYHTRKDMTRAVFESTGFIDMDFINEIEKTGIEIKNIRSSGGLARFNFISQIKSDITGKEVYVLSDFETTAAGAAMLVFEAVNVFSDMYQAAQVFADIRMIIRPNYKNHMKYQKIYRLFKQIYGETKGLYQERHNLFYDIYKTRDCTIENI